MYNRSNEYNETRKEDFTMVGFDIGGTKCAVSIGRIENGRLLIANKRKIATDLTVSPYEMIDRMCALAEEMTDDTSAIGISCGGPLDAENGIIQSPPNLPGWNDVKIVEYLKSKYNGRVALENDANACAVAEWKFGAGKGSSNMIFLTFGTGFGAGLIIDGRLYRGANGNAGEVGHIRLERFGPVGYGKAGSFEGFASGGGIAQLAKSAARERLQAGYVTGYCASLEELESVTAATVAKAAEDGDDVACEVYRLCGEMLGRGLSILVDILNPEKIVIGSIFTRSGELLRASMEEVMKRECLPSSLAAVSVLPASLGEELGDYAALSLAE